MDNPVRIKVQNGLLYVHFGEVRIYLPIPEEGRTETFYLDSKKDAEEDSETTIYSIGKLGVETPVYSDRDSNDVIVRIDDGCGQRMTMELDFSDAARLSDALCDALGNIREREGMEKDAFDTASYLGYIDQVSSEVKHGEGEDTGEVKMTLSGESGRNIVLDMCVDEAFSVMTGIKDALENLYPGITRDDDDEDQEEVDPEEA